MPKDLGCCDRSTNRNCILTKKKRGRGWWWNITKKKTDGYDIKQNAAITPCLTALYQSYFTVGVSLRGLTFSDTVS